MWNILYNVYHICECPSQAKCYAQIVWLYKQLTFLENVPTCGQEMLSRHGASFFSSHGARVGRHFIRSCCCRPINRRNQCHSRVVHSILWFPLGLVLNIYEGQLFFFSTFVRTVIVGKWPNKQNKYTYKMSFMSETNTAQGSYIHSCAFFGGFTAC